MFVFIYNYYPENFTVLILRVLELFTHKVCEIFVCKHTETIEHVKNRLLFKKEKQTLRENNSKILRIKNAKFSGHYFRIN